MTRKVIDCRDFPSETNCTLMISGREFEVLQASAEHARHDPWPHRWSRTARAASRHDEGRGFCVTATVPAFAA